MDCNRKRKGRAQTAETRRKIGAANKGKLKGRKRNPESVKKSAEGRKRGAFFNCRECGSEFWRQPSAIKKGRNKFCSKKCYQTNQVGKPKSEAFKEYCRTRTGEKSPTWKGGITPEHLRIRSSQAMRYWRQSVFDRDLYTCQHCYLKPASRSNGLLHAHHIKSFAGYPDLRFDISNGITLCKECHYKEHSNE